MGKITKKYSTGMPMFFFATGSPAGFRGLLPHTTWNMKAHEFIERYVKIYKKRNRSRFRTYGRVALDNSYRGYGWDTGSVKDNDIEIINGY